MRTTVQSATSRHASSTSVSSHGAQGGLTAAQTQSCHDPGEQFGQLRSGAAQRSDLRGLLFWSPWSATRPAPASAAAQSASAGSLSRRSRSHSSTAAASGRRLQHRVVQRHGPGRAWPAGVGQRGGRIGQLRRLLEQRIHGQPVQRVVSGRSRTGRQRRGGIAQFGARIVNVREVRAVLGEVVPGDEGGQLANMLGRRPDLVLVSCRMRSASSARRLRQLIGVFRAEGRRVFGRAARPRSSARCTPSAAPAGGERRAGLARAHPAQQIIRRRRVAGALEDEADPLPDPGRLAGHLPAWLPGRVGGDRVGLLLAVARIQAVVPGDGGVPWRPDGLPCPGRRKGRRSPCRAGRPAGRGSWR